MDKFHIIDDGAAILRSKGVYRQAKVYRRGEQVFAGHGSGYVRLNKGGATSIPDVSWLGIEATGVDISGQPRWAE